MSGETVRSEEKLLRQLALPGLWLLIINGMIGAGIFGLPGELARLGGHGSAWVFVLCALTIAPIMLCFMQMASYFRGTGGPILYAASAFGPMAGFQVGWLYYISRVLSFAANLNLLLTSLGYVWDGAMDPTWRVALAFAICALMSLINVLGARGAIGLLGSLTALKFVPLILLVVVGLVELDIGSLLPAFEPGAGVTDLGAAVFLVIYAYVGFEGGLVPAGEARHPQRDLPRALLLGLLVCALLYAAVQAVAVASLPSLPTSSRPLVDVAAALMGEVGAAVMLTATMASVGGNLLGAMFSTPRMSYRMALDGFLPVALARVHPRFHTPATSIVLYGAASFAFAVSGGFVWLAGLSVLARLILYIVCIAAMPRLHRRHAQLPGALRLAGWPLWMLLALLACAILLWQVTLAAVLVTAGCVLAGLALFACSRRFDPRLDAQSAQQRIEGTGSERGIDAARSRRSPV